VVDQSMLSYVTGAGPVVKVVMLALLLASVVSWTFIFQRWFYLKRVRGIARQFTERFWSGGDLNALYNELSHRQRDIAGLEYIFHAAFSEFVRLRKQPDIKPKAVMEGVQRAMRIAQSHEIDHLEQHLSFLATVGSTSPYVGLFGTVWGIMTSFHALGNVQQATISMVAPGISEALIATAMGLFAAIPAVIAYNRYVNQTERLTNQYETFQDEFSKILSHQAVDGTSREKSS